jgi:diguanylate cyclase (GGDEF)-like protein/PAS domain S-box-containing protein
MGAIYFCLGLGVGVIALLMYRKYEKANWAARFENEKRIFQLVENSKDIVYYYQVKPELQFRYLSPSIKKFLGQGILEEAYENPYSPFERIHPEDYKIFSKKIYGGHDYSQTLIQRWKDDKGNYRWFEEYATPIYEKGELIAVQGIIRNIDEKVKLQQDFEYRITHDALTNIYNREFFEQYMEKYNNHIDTSAAIILCDLDELKYVNDHYGHKKGDFLIKESANLLNRFFTENAIVARIGGDEFAIIIIDTDKAEVEHLCHKLSEKINEYNINSKDIKIKMSMGYVFNEHSIGKMENLFAEADKNMYQDKYAKKEQNIMKLGR